MTRGEAHRCLLAMAHRRVIAYATVETLKELSNLLADRGDKAKHPPAASWVCRVILPVAPRAILKQLIGATANQLAIDPDSAKISTAGFLK